MRLKIEEGMLLYQVPMTALNAQEFFNSYELRKDGGISIAYL